ncbi:hypothetical protein ZWY2020_042548 [Hordeum vulgare]|nr:hypothetical protein ZWY2020_042548 [Hordeum vulgare]
MQPGIEDTLAVRPLHLRVPARDRRVSRGASSSLVADLGVVLLPRNGKLVYRRWGDDDGPDARHQLERCIRRDRGTTCRESCCGQPSTNDEAAWLPSAGLGAADVAAGTSVEHSPRSRNRGARAGSEADREGHGDGATDRPLGERLREQLMRRADGGLTDPAEDRPDMNADGWPPRPKWPAARGGSAASTQGSKSYSSI